MKPYQVAFYVYAENESEVKELQIELNNFVRDRYNKGILVTSKKLVSALKKFGDSFIVNNFLAK